MVGEIVSVKLIVRGIVQGIGFRWFIKQIADEEKINGYVRNNFDGSVEIVAETTKDVLERFIHRIKTEHSYAQIQNLEFVPQHLQGHKKFRIEF